MISTSKEYKSSAFLLLRSAKTGNRLLFTVGVAEIVYYTNNKTWYIKNVMQLFHNTYFFAPNKEPCKFKYVRIININFNRCVLLLT